MITSGGGPNTNASLGTTNSSKNCCRMVWRDVRDSVIATMSTIGQNNKYLSRRGLVHRAVSAVQFHCIANDDVVPASQPQRLSIWSTTLHYGRVSHCCAGLLCREDSYDQTVSGETAPQQTACKSPPRSLVWSCSATGCFGMSGDHNVHHLHVVELGIDRKFHVVCGASRHTTIS